MNSSISDAIKQKRIDSLAAKHLHVRLLSNLNKRQRLVDFLAIAVPLIYVPVRYLAKNTEYALAVETAWELLAALLVVLVVLKIVYRWQDRSQICKQLLGENISLIGQADQLLRDVDHISPEGSRLFFTLAEKSETEDRDLLGESSDKDRQFAYREALKEAVPGSSTTVCPGCGSSPWNFRPGSCQLCGNTPTPKA
jgi:mobilome CxxCx(11)CxxC protein